MSRRLRVLLFLVALLLPLTGCGKERERGKNKNLDRPISADKRGV